MSEKYIILKNQFDEEIFFLFLSYSETTFFLNYLQRAEITAISHIAALFLPEVECVDILSWQNVNIGTEVSC